jgi:anti-sigma factor RsiW
MTDGRHLADGLQELVDGRLDAPARSRAEAHLADCERCRRELDVLRALKRGLRNAGASADVPSELDALIRGAIGREPSDEGRGRPRALPWLIAAAAAVVALVSALFLKPDVSARVARDYAEFRSGALPLELETADPERLEAFFRERGLPYRVFDLQMMGFRLVGGRVHRVGGRTSAFYVYRGEGNKILICQMYPVEIGDLPRGAERRVVNGIPFHVVRRGGTNMVFWPEGDVACVLVSDLPPQEVLALAVAKAKIP